MMTNRQLIHTIGLNQGENGTVKPKDEMKETHLRRIQCSFVKHY